jgi:MFS family permease
VSDQTSISMPATAGKANPQPWPSPAKVWIGVSVFGLTVMLLFMNAGVIGLLVEMIKHDLGLSDTRASFVLGLSGVLFASFLGLPVARLVDRMSRRLLIGLGLFVMGVSTAACGLSQGFWTLLIARTVGGIGGVGNGPATFSILADYFPPAKLPKALAVMNIGFVISQAAAPLLGGALIALIATVPPVTVPVFGTLHPWQVVLIVIAIPEILLAILTLTVVHEPKRRGADQSVVPLKDVFRFLYDNRSAFGPMFGGLALNSLGAGTLAWVPAFYMRTYGWGPAQYGVIQGTVLLIIAPLGLLAGGFLAEWYAKRGYDDANMRVVFLAMLIHVPFAIAYPLMPTPILALAVAAVNTTIVGALAGPQNAALQVILPNRMRGIITALFLLTFMLIGFGIAPTVVALLTNYVFQSEALIRYSIVTMNAVVGPLAAIVFYMGMKPYGEAFARARSWHS